MSITNTDFIDNSVSNRWYAFGGAIYNSGSITALTGDFIGNYASSLTSPYTEGGAIYNYYGIITTLTGDFIGNYTMGHNGAKGGAIYNDGGTITTLRGDFIDNYVSSSGSPSSAYGGAIYNNSGSITTLTGDFIDNYASSGSSIAKGGAIYHHGVNVAITTLTGDFIGNYALGSSQAQGGVIYNDGGTITTLTGDFTGNHASSSAQAQGGAIYNYYGTIATLSGDFIGNYVTGDIDSKGGAIYNNDSSKIGLLANIKNITFSDNTANGVSNAYHGNDSTAVLNLNTGADRSIIFNDSITGTGVININATHSQVNTVPSTSNAYNKGKVFLNQDMSGYRGITNLYGGTIKMGEGKYDSNWDTFNHLPLDVPVEKTTTPKFFGGTFNVKGNSTLDMQNSRIDTISLMALNLDSGVLSLAIDASLNTDGDNPLTADNFDVANGYVFSGTAVINSINIIDPTVKRESHVTIVNTEGDTELFRNEISLDDNLKINGSTESNYKVMYYPSSGELIFLDTTKNLKYFVNDSNVVANEGRTRTYNLFTNENVTEDLGALTGTSLTINGANDYSIVGNNHKGVTVGDGQTLNINNVTVENFQNGFAQASGTGKIHIADSTFQNNTRSGSLVQSRSLLVLTDGSTVKNSIFSGNENDMYSIYAISGKITVEDTDFINNQATPLYLDGGSLILKATTKDVTLNNSTPTVEREGIASNSGNMYFAPTANRTITIGDKIASSYRTMTVGSDGTTDNYEGTTVFNGTLTTSGTNWTKLYVKSGTLENNSTYNGYLENNATITGNGSLITQGGTNTGSISQKAITIGNGFTTDASNISVTDTVNDFITNNSQFRLTGGTLNEIVKGTGTTIITKKGETPSHVTIGSTGDIQQKILVEALNTLTANTSQLDGVIENQGTLNLSGNLNKNINGSGTTKINTSLNITGDSTISGGLDLNNGKLDMQDASETFSTLSVRNLKGEGDLKIDADMRNNGSDKATNNDKISITNITNAGTGTLNLTSIKVTADGEVGTFIDNYLTYLVGDTTGLTFKLNNSSDEDAKVESLTDTMRYTFTKGSTAGALKAEIEAKSSNLENFITGNDIDANTYNINSNKNYTDVIGTTHRDNDTRELFLNLNHGADLIGNVTNNGITVADGYTLNIDGSHQAGVTVKNFDKSLINNGTLNVKNIAFNGNTTDIENNATLNLEGTNSITAGIVGTNGTTNIKSGTTTASSISQKILNILSGAKLNAKADNLAVTNGVTNAGTLELTDGNLNSNITGNGTTQIQGNVVNDASIEQNNLIIDSGASFTNNSGSEIPLWVKNHLENSGTFTTKLMDFAIGNSSSYGSITNNASATININSTGVNENYDIIVNVPITNNGTINYTGNGNFTLSSQITGNTGILNIKDGARVVSSGNITQDKVGIYSGSSLTNTGVIAASVINDGTLTSSADKIIGEVENTGTYNIQGGTLNNSITGTGAINLAEGVKLTLGSDASFDAGQTFNAGNNSTISLMGAGSTITATIDGLTIADGDMMNLEIDWKNVFNSAGITETDKVRLSKIDLTSQTSDHTYDFTNLNNKVAIGEILDLAVDANSVNKVRYNSTTGELISTRTNLVNAVGDADATPSYYALAGDESGADAVLTNGNLSVQGNNKTLITKGIEIGNNSILILNNLHTADGTTLNLTGGGTSNLKITNVSNETLNLKGDIISTNESNRVSFTGNKDIVFSGLFDPAIATVYMPSAQLIRSGQDDGIDWNLNGGTLKYTNDTYLYNPAHHTTPELLNSMNFNGGSLDMRNGATSTIALSALTLTNNSNLYLDVDLANKTMDKFTTATPATYNGGTLHVAGMNLISDAAETLTTINFTSDPSLMGHVDYTGAQNITALSPIYRYNVGYENSTGNFNFTRSGGSDGFNPAILATPVAAQVGSYLTQLNNYEQAFANMDMMMLMTKKQRQAMKFANKYASTQGPASGGVITYDPNQIPEQKRGAWFRPFATFENVGLENGPTVGNIAYGSLFGTDSDLIELSHGWDMVWSAYAGYNGSHQTYDTIGIYQNGGTIGASTAFYKGNFFTGLTANVGANVGKASTMYGDDTFTMLTTGIASKTGYNFELADGKFIIQPNYLMSYSFINTFDYTNAAGININSDPLNAIQIAPGIKFIGNLKNGWQPYASVQMVWNIMDKTKFSANEVSLPDLSVKPYIQYGVGLQKRWGDRFTAFGQAMIRNGGRNGVALQAGFHWTLGKDSSELKSEATKETKKTENTTPQLQNARFNLSSMR